MPKSKNCITRYDAVKGAAAPTGAVVLGLPSAAAAQGGGPQARSCTFCPPRTTTLLLKASFRSPQAQVQLTVAGTSHAGSRSDSEGRHWTFLVRGLPSDVEHELQLRAGNVAMCDPWPLRTLPTPDAEVASFRFLSFTCAGGDPKMRGPNGEESFRTIEVRHRLLAPAMSFAPQAVVANGDQVYWNQTTLLQSRNKTIARIACELYESYGMFDRSQPVLGSPNANIIRRIGEAQIAAVYRTTLRSMPTCLVADDPDHFEDDEAEERFVTFSPDHFEVEAKRPVQRLFHSEFLPAPARSQGLPGVRDNGPATAFGSLRVGKLLEALIYDCGGYLPLKGPSPR